MTNSKIKLAEGLEYLMISSKIKILGNKSLSESVDILGGFLNNRGIY